MWPSIPARRLRRDDGRLGFAGLSRRRGQARPPGTRAATRKVGLIPAQFTSQTSRACAWKGERDARRRRPALVVRSRNEPPIATRTTFDLGSESTRHAARAGGDFGSSLERSTTSSTSRCIAATRS
jgi:hypothetical protein